MSLRALPCDDCKHLHLDAEGRITGGGPSCAAFPEGIPREIFFDEVPHLEPYPGDHGIQYEPIDPENDIYAQLEALVEGQEEFAHLQKEIQTIRARFRKS